jgi:uncharacterized membrane protein HdeD (DUF308 family)
MKNMLLRNWHLMRFIRLVLAVFLFFNAYETREWFFVVFGIFFLAQALFNFGCGANGCNVNYKKIENEK